MVLWKISSYSQALHLDARLHRARHQLTTQFGRQWKQSAPADVVWMLTTAPFADEACAEVEALLNRKKPAIDVDNTSKAEQRAYPDQAPENINEPEDQLEKAIRINEQHWAQRSRPASADTLREQLHIGAARARQLTATVRAMDKAAVEKRNRPHLIRPSCHEGCVQRNHPHSDIVPWPEHHLLRLRAD